MESDCRTAAELQQWAKTMGFVPGLKFVSSEEYPKPEIFQKICKGKVTKLWSDVMKHVRPKDEILHIQKNLLLQRLRSGKPLDKNPVPGHLSEQMFLAAKLAEKEKERDTLLESIQKKESSIRAKEKSLRKSSHKSIELENQIDEFRKKQLLFKMKSEESRSKLAWLKDVADVARDLCPPSPNAKPASAKFSDSETMLYKCIDAIQDFHSKDHGGDMEFPDGDQSIETPLQQLWKQIRLNSNGWGAQQIWNAINSKLLTELMEEISVFCGDDSNARPIHSQASLVQSAVSILPAKYMTSLLEFINLETKVRLKKNDLEKLQEELINSVEIAKLNTTNLNKTVSAPEFIRALVEAQSKKAVLSGKLQGIKAELIPWKEKMSDCAAASHSLKLATEELARLDLQIDSDKKQIVENLVHMKMIACKLRSVRAKALAQRSNFNIQVPSFFTMMRNRHYFDSEEGAISPDLRNVRASSTMIGNETADSNLSFNTTCDSVGDKYSDSPEMLAVLRESISKEAKLFIKVHLESVPFVVVNGRKESVCNLMVQAPLMTSRCLNMPQRNFLQIVRGTPFSSTPDILLKQLFIQTHVRALHLYKAIHEIPVSTDHHVSGHLGTLNKSCEKNESDLREKTEFVRASLNHIKLLVTNSNANFDCWLERPVQNAIPESLEVNGSVFTEWCKRYDKAQPC
ncbi:uncharacterized protein LOC117641885 [Thrips palmi]|uniref:Uncharacterized protein LOC117641885 n=1 Tax=Thrips palmi TaxID=161013 RepID=A0A6P8YG79_THRPL|nr:uncharacterized protein LOC117641885 [Thrips palmi]